MRHVQFSQNFSICENPENNMRAKIKRFALYQAMVVTRNDRDDNDNGGKQRADLYTISDVKVTR